MKILVISELFPPDVKGGYEMRCEDACYWLYQNGYQLEVLTTQLEYKVNNHPFPVYRKLIKYPNGRTPTEWPTWKKYYYALLDNYSFSKALEQTDPDLIYIWKCSEISRSLIPNIFQTPVLKLVDISSSWFHKVATQHGPVYRFIESRSGSLIKNIIKKCVAKILPFFSLGLFSGAYIFDWDNLVGYFTSHWNKKFHTEHIPECNSFSVFHTGIDLTIFPFEQKKHFTDPVKLLFVGRIEEDKGFYLLLDQLNHGKSINLLLTVIGNFPNEQEKRKIQTKIMDLGLESKINFLGQIKREMLFTYYQQNDFTVFPSVWDEPFSRVPIESMACGTPCISTDNPGSKELFDLDAPLILLERTRQSLANILDKVTCNKDQYGKLSLEGRKFVEGSFTFDRFMRNIERTFLDGWNDGIG